MVRNADALPFIKRTFDTLDCLDSGGADTIEPTSKKNRRNTDNEDIQTSEQTDEADVPDVSKKNSFDAESKKVFREKFLSMDESKKLTLQSGRVVEDVMFEHGMTFQHVQ
ncbi:hypothetical protein HDU78_006796 [Chytriomyces hyalinus]|nr:hypothetical protein HDU78_006796 [Chytriomyces hyalinus]